jgi:phosphate transport system substrate-binding protein
MTTRICPSLLAACVLALSAVAHAQIIKIDGSSTVYPVTEAVAEEFQTAQKNKIKVTVGISGTGGGFKKFVRGETDLQNASRPILAAEMDQARANGIEYIELPICFDALTVAVHPKNDWVDSIKVSELKKLWEPGAQGKITKWNQIRPTWPDKEIKLYGAGSDSGTFDYFTEAIVGKAKASRGDYTGSEDDNVLVQGIEGDRFALGYLPFAYFAPHATRMKAVAIEWDVDSITGKQVSKPASKPSLEAVLAGNYNPLSRPLFIYVNKKASDSRPEVKQFVEFYLKNAADLAKEVKYLPLPVEAYQMAQKRFANGETGTGFGGEAAIGLPVKEILERKPTR